ncbi:hypothetical protein J6590_071239 [Homalodisca vitripennis]|nr:hypothetical protein J6590_071239 [Homalodisca vitripennis]
MIVQMFLNSRNPLTPTCCSFSIYMFYSCSFYENQTLSVATQQVGSWRKLTLKPVIITICFISLVNIESTMSYFLQKKTKQTIQRSINTQNHHTSTMNGDC